MPLIVLPRPREAEAAAALPFAATIDYCAVAYLVTYQGASSRMAEVLERLRALLEEDVAPKRAALRRVRSAFVWDGGGGRSRPRPRPRPSVSRRDGGGGGTPDNRTLRGAPSSAVEWMLAAACAASRELRGEPPPHAPPPVRPACHDRRSCDDGYVQLGAAGMVKVGGSCLLA